MDDLKLDFVLGNEENNLGSSADGEDSYSEGFSDYDFSIVRGMISSQPVNYDRMYLTNELLVIDDGVEGEFWLEDISDYFDAKNILANRNSARMLVAGDSEENVIVGGTGETTMWGGSGGASDILYGDSSNDVFVYGQGEGNDTIYGANDNELVLLYNINFDDIVATNLYGDGIQILFNTGNVLTVNDAGISSYTPEFEFADGSRRFMSKGSNQWVTTREAQTTAQ